MILFKGNNTEVFFTAVHCHAFTMLEWACVITDQEENATKSLIGINSVESEWRIKTNEAINSVKHDPRTEFVLLN